MPPVIIVIGFLVAVLAVGAGMAYFAWRGSKPSSFFLEAVHTTYDLTLPEAEIDAYFELKDRLQQQYAPEAFRAEEDETVMSPEATMDRWVLKVPTEERGNLQKALMRRLVPCIDKLDQVQRDKPGNWKLWRGKLVSERYWGSLCDAESMVSQEIDACILEAAELEPAWKDHIFPQAVQCWRMQKQQDMEKRVQKKVVLNEKKQKEKDVKRKEIEEKLKEADKQRQEKLAEKMMEKLLREEEQACAAKSKAKPKTTAATAKPKAKKK